MPKTVFLHHCYLALNSRLRSRSKVRVNVTGQGQILWCAAVYIKGPALLNAAKNNKSHYQSKVFVCVSVISGHRCHRSAFNYLLKLYSQPLLDILTFSLLIFSVVYLASKKCQSVFVTS